MRPLALILAALAALAAGCGDNDEHVPNDVSDGIDAAVDAGIDADIDASPATLESCLDRPTTDLPRPPTDSLPCELVPPGLVIQQ